MASEETRKSAKSPERVFWKYASKALILFVFTLLLRFLEAYSLILPAFLWLLHLGELFLVVATIARLIRGLCKEGETWKDRNQ